MSASAPSRKPTRAARRRELDPDELAALEEERDFLLRSLEDLEAEHDAGDIEEDDYLALKDDYTARAARALRSIDDRKQRLSAAAPPRPRSQVVLVVGGVVLVAVLAGFLVARSSGVRTGDQGITGGDQVLTTRDLLVQASSLDAQGQALEAIQVYDEVLAEDPDNVEALTYRAWILVRAGLYEEAQTYLDQAIDLDPTYPDARAFQAISYARQCRTDEALAAVDEFRAVDPPESMIGLVEGLEAQLQDGAECTPATPTGGDAGDGDGAADEPGGTPTTGGDG